MSNNPLKYTDPSGYFLDKVFKELRRFGDKLKAELRRMSPGLATAISIGLSFVSPWLAGGFSAALADANGASFGEIAVSFGIGYAGGQFNGSLNGALHGTISNAFLRGAVSGALTGAFTGGVQATINGTSLRKGVQDGMAAGALTSGIVGAIRGNPAEKVVQSNGRREGMEALKSANLTDAQKADIQKRLDAINAKAGTRVASDADGVAKWLDAQTDTLRTDYGIEFGAQIVEVGGGAGFDRIVTGYYTNGVDIGAPVGGYLGDWHNHPAGSLASADDVTGWIDSGGNGYVSLGGGEIQKFNYQSFDAGRTEFITNLYNSGVTDTNKVMNAYRGWVNKIATFNGQDFSETL